MHVIPVINRQRLFFSKLKTRLAPATNSLADGLPSCAVAPRPRPGCVWPQRTNATLFLPRELPLVGLPLRPQK